MDSFMKKLKSRIIAVNSLLCIGLDPTTTDAASAILFCLEIIEKTHPFAAAFKPNSAFFEAFGPEGMEALKTVMSAIPKDIPIILDCKRGDIDTTAHAYAVSSFGIYNAAAVTLSPYMGWDSIQPFVRGKYNGRCAFILCKTSNNSSADFQDQKLLSGMLLYEKVISKCLQWNSSMVADGCDEGLGVVVGATDISALNNVRNAAPDMWILCPGVGAQGGCASTVCDVGLRKDGSGLLISVSRGISGAVDKVEAATLLRDEINNCRQNKIAKSESVNVAIVALEQYQRDFISFALMKNVLQFGSFKLKSGRISPYFFNAGLFCSGDSMFQLATSYAIAIRKSGIEFDVFFGPAYKGIPLVHVIAMAWYQLYNENKDICYNRKEVKDHGEGGLLVGASINGRRVLIIDDVITAGTAIRECVDILSVNSATIVAVIVSLDRQERANDTCSESAIQQVQHDFGFPVFSIVQLSHIISYVQSQDSFSSQDLHTIVAYRQQYGIL